MAGIRTGGCQCGAIRYEVSADPIALYACHCSECQKQTSSAFGMSMTVPRDGLRIVKGEPKTWTRSSDSGRAVVCHFCGDCGTRLFHDAKRAPDSVNLKPGTLDDTGWLKPVGNLWTNHAQPWVHISGEALNYETQPDDFASLAAKWREHAE